LVTLYIAIALVLRLLRKRFGTDGDRYASQLYAFELEQLEALSEALFDFTSVADLEVWLRAHGQ
jgi:hypothetical protein